MRIDHIALYCLDLEGMKSFFEKYFGCSSNELYHNPRTELKTYILSFPCGSTRLEIMQRPEVTETLTEKHRAGFIHMSIATGSKEGVDAKTTKLQNAGYICIDGPRTTGDGYYESQVIGPEGILLEITI